MSASIKLTGGKAVAALVVIAAVAAFQFLARTSTLGTEAAEQIKIHLASDYTRFSLPEIQRQVQSASVSTDDVSKLVSSVSPDNIEIMNITARGRGDDIAVRVEVRVSDGVPPDGRSVRYFKLRHSTLTGWTVRQTTTAMSYYLAML
jgi:hypothetical protein